AALMQHRLPQIAEYADALRYIVQTEVFDLHTALHFFPADRSGHGRPRRGPDRVNRSQRPTPGVLVIVDQHMRPGPLGYTILSGDGVGVPSFHRRGQSLNEFPALFLLRAANDWNVNVNTT